MIVVLANYLGSRVGRLGSLWALLGAGVLAGPPFVLVLLQPDLGTALVFGAILVATLFMSGASLRWLGILAATAVAAFPFVWTYILADYQKARLTAFLNPLADIQGTGYQLYQAQIAVSSGGWFGVGLTNGTQNALGLLPVQDTDFVFAILAEELGFIGALVVLGLFVALLWRVLTAGWRSKDPFGTIFACGVAAMLLFQLVRERRDGDRDHADHGHPAAVHQPRRRVADQHRARAWACSRASTSARAAPSGEPPPPPNRPFEIRPVRCECLRKARPIGQRRRNSPCRWSACACSLRRLPSRRGRGSSSARYGRPMGIRSSHSV